MQQWTLGLHLDNLIVKQDWLVARVIVDGYLDGKCEQI